MEAIFSLGNLYFDIISLIIIVALIVAIIIGAVKGFLYSLIKFAQVFVVFGAAILLAKPLGDALFNSGLGDKLVTNLTPSIEGMGTMFAAPLTADNKLEYITSGLIELNIPSFIADGLAEKIMTFVTLETEETLGAYISQGIVNYSLIAISFLVIALLLTIVFAILKAVAKKINDVPVLGGINRTLGGILSGAVAYIIVDALLFLISFVTLKDGSLSSFFVQTMYLDQEGVYTLSKFISQHSIMRLILEALI